MSPKPKTWVACQLLIQQKKLLLLKLNHFNKKNNLVCHEIQPNVAFKSGGPKLIYQTKFYNYNINRETLD